MARSINISTTVPADLKEELDKMSVELDRPISWVIRKILTDYFATENDDQMTK